MSYTDTAPPYPYPYFDLVFEFDWQELKATFLKANSPAWQPFLFSSCESGASVISAFWHQVAWLSSLQVSTTTLSGNEQRLFPFLKWKTARFLTIYWVFITWRWYLYSCWDIFLPLGIRAYIESHWHDAMYTQSCIFSHVFCRLSSYKYVTQSQSHHATRQHIFFGTLACHDSLKSKRSRIDNKLKQILVLGWTWSNGLVSRKE